MPQGKIKSLFKTRKKNLAIIEYNDGKNMIYYSSTQNTTKPNLLSKGDKVNFNVKSGNFGIEAGNVFRING